MFTAVRTMPHKPRPIAAAHRRRAPSHAAAPLHRRGLHHRAARSNPIQRWQRVGVYASVVLLLLSGALWLGVHFLGWPASSRPAMEGLPSPWEPILMKVHGAATMAALFFIGGLAATHVVRGWRLRERRASGVTLLALAAALTLTGYALYYLLPENWRDATGWLHGGLGLLWAALVWAHRRRPGARG